MNHFKDLPSLPPGMARRLNSVCDRFEEQWLAGSEPRLEDFLPLVDESDRRALLRELLALELEYRGRRGQQPTSEPYLRRLPEFSDVIAAAFAAPQQRIPTPVNPNDGQTEPPKTGDQSMGPGLSETSSLSEKITPDLPKRVGRYHVEHEIDRGGMGQIVRVTDEAFQRPLAMKIALEGLSEDAHERFVREALLTGQLQHPGIPPVQEMGKLEDGRPYFVMKLIKGSDLGTLLRKRTSAGADLPRWVAIFEQICQTMGYAHSRGIIHRDLKPANIMVGAFGEVQVMDWGLAKLLTTDAPAKLGETLCEKQQPSTVFAVVTPNTLPKETQPGTIMGTSAYMPPEQARGEAETLDPRCDVFGLGGILCEVLTGKPPFAEKTILENQRLSMKGDVSAAFSRLDACGADAELVDLAKLCLAPDRENRPAHAGIVAEAVARYQAALQERMQQAEIDKASALVKVREERKRWRVSLALAAAVLFLIVGGSASALWYQAERARQDADKIRQDAELALRKAESERKRLLAEEEVRKALDQAEMARSELHEALKKPGGVFELLNDPAHWKARIQVGNAALDRARALLANAEAGVDPTLSERAGKLQPLFRQDEADRVLAVRLEKIRMDKVGARVRKDPVELRALISRFTGEYSTTFSKAGLDIAAGRQQELAALIQQSAIKDQLLAALDAYADMEFIAGNRGLADTLMALANLADPDPLLDKFRDPALWQDEIAMERVALEVKADEALLAKLTPAMFGRVAIVLPRGATKLNWLRMAQARYPADFWANMRLSQALLEENNVPLGNIGSPAFAQIRVNLSEAAGYSRVAVAIRPGAAQAWNNLGVSLQNMDPPMAIKAYKKSVDIDPTVGFVWNSLGTVLMRQGDVPGAATAFEKATAADPDDDTAWFNLGVVRSYQKNLPEALKAFENSVKADPKSAFAWAGVGTVLLKQKDRNLLEATNALRHAVKLKEDEPEANLYLGIALFEQGEFAEALSALEKGHRLGIQRPGWTHGSANLVKLCQEHLALDKKLPDVLNGENASVPLELALAELCRRYKRRYRDAAELYAKAFAAEPNRAEDMIKGHRFNAACAAALASAGNGIRADALSDLEKSRLRKQASDWLRADLAAWARILEKFPIAAIRDPIQHYRSNNDLAGLRDEKDLAKLPAGDRAALLEFWADAARVAKQARARYTQNEYKGQLAEKEREQAHPVKMMAGKTYVIDMESRAFKTIVRLEEGAGKAVAASNDFYATAPGSPGINFKDVNAPILVSRIIFTPREDATYRVVATSFQKLGKGNYTVIVSEFASLESREPIRTGKAQPEKSAEAIGLAKQSIKKRHYALATRLYREAFRKEPALADNLDLGHRYDAACYAVLAAAGKGDDSAALTAEQSAQLRQEALTWLKADLAAWTKRVADGTDADRKAAAKKLRLWQRDTDLTWVRSGGLDDLPAAERPAWQQLWVDVGALLKKVEPQR